MTDSLAACEYYLPSHGGSRRISCMNFGHSCGGLAIRSLDKILEAADHVLMDDS